MDHNWKSMMAGKAAPRSPVMNASECSAYVNEIFAAAATRFEVQDISSMRARVRMAVGPEDIRPGGTVSGPAMFWAVDCTFYIALLGMIGKKALAVTTNANINFLNKPAPRDIICEARILKLGKLLATGEATIWSEGDEDRPVAHATLTYAIPPEPR